MKKCGEPPGSGSRPRVAGFTLLEVMVAIAILALTMTALFSSEGGAIATTTRIKRVSVATMLARYRMSEIEERFVREGWNETDESGEGPCAEDEDYPGFSCRWSSETVELPSQMDLQTAAGNAIFGGGGSQEEGTPADPNASAHAQAGLGMIDQLYPMVSQLLQQSIRKVNVTVVWREGRHERSVRVTQFLTNASNLAPLMALAASLPPPPAP